MVTQTWSAPSSHTWELAIQWHDRFFVHKHGGGLMHYASGTVMQSKLDDAEEYGEPSFQLGNTICGAWRDIGGAVICTNTDHDHKTICKRCLKVNQ